MRSGLRCGARRRRHDGLHVVRRRVETNRVEARLCRRGRRYTHFHDDYDDPDLAGRCFGDGSGAWAPFYSDLSDPQRWGNVTSAQNEPAAYKSSCSTRADCSYNGKCEEGVCACHAQWMGKYCGQLALVATDADAGLQTVDDGGRVSSWGGSVLKGDDAASSTWRLLLDARREAVLSK